MSTQQIMFDLLESNEATEVHLSDAELLQRAIALLPSKIALTLLSRKIPISTYRTRYNCGRLGKSPKYNSFRYLNGVAVNNHDHPLSLRAKAGIASKHGIADERLIGEAKCQ